MLVPLMRLVRVGPVLLTLLVACSTMPDSSEQPSTTEQRIMTVGVTGSDGHISVLTVIDRAGVVLNATTDFPESLAASVTDAAVANPSDNPATLSVVWVALPCERHPLLKLTEVDGRLVITLDRGRREPAECDSLGVVNGVTLELAREARAEMVRLKSQSRPPLP